MLSVIGLSHSEKYNRYWHCECDCGKAVIRHQGSLVKGYTLSCGCRKKMPNAGHFKKTHGRTRSNGEASRIYKIWSAMKDRTGNPKAHAYERYGGVGITVCDEWRDSFEAFARDMGDPPSSKHTIDRKDNSLGYTPDNCRWATYSEQNLNRSNVIKVFYEGEHVALAALAHKFGMPVNTVRSRVTKQGWDVDRALKTPIKK